MNLSGLEIFKYLPASTKSEHSNCKECGYNSCMAFALGLAKNYELLEKCPYINQSLIEKINKNHEQKEIEIGLTQKTKIGGETAMFRHDKKFINPTSFFIAIDTDNHNFEAFLNKVLKFEIKKMSKIYKIDGILLKGSNITEDLRLNIEKNDISTITKEELENYKLVEINDDEKDFSKTMEKLICTRKKAIFGNDINYTSPTFIYLKSHKNLVELSAKAGFYICKYANMLIFEDFDEALFSTLIALRQNIYSDPQAPLQVESKIYKFNEPNETSAVFLTTNFSLTYYTMANELEEIDIPSYLILVPTGGMSVLAAWAAEKLTTDIIAETIDKLKVREKIKTREIIIPGLLEPIKEKLQKKIPDFKIITGAKEAYQTRDFIKTYKIKNFAI